MEYIKSLDFDILLVIVTILVLLFILGKFGFSIIKKLLIGLVFSAIAGGILYFFFDFPIETVSAISLVAFFIGFVFGKIKVSE